MQKRIDFGPRRLICGYNPAAGRTVAVLRENASRMAPPADYYALLGVERDADAETIKRAFRSRAREVHPDVSDAPGAEDRFRQLAHAYRVLAAPDARALYDRFGDRGRGNGGRVVAELVLARPAARRGARRTIRIPRLDVCAACGGEGAIGLCPTCGGSRLQKRASHGSFGRLVQFDDCPDCAVCSECGGSGRVAGERLLEAVVPPKTRNGDAVALDHGESVRVRVRPLVDESRVVRYGAAAALAVAVAFLVYLAFFS